MHAIYVCNLKPIPRKATPDYQLSGWMQLVLTPYGIDFVVERSRIKMVKLPE